MHHTQPAGAPQAMSDSDPSAGGGQGAVGRFKEEAARVAGYWPNQNLQHPQAQA